MSKGKTKKWDIGSIFSKHALLIVFIAMFVFFSIRTENFLTISNLTDVVRSNSISGLLAVGLTYVILAGGIDLSVDSTAALAGIVAGSLSYYSPVIAVLAGLGVGVFFGLFNGFLIVKTGVQPFIFTIGASRLIRGIILVFTRGANIYNVGEEFKSIARSDISPIPTPILIFTAIIVVSFLLLNKSKYGRYIYAVGSNEEAARLSGIKTKQIRASTWLISGVLAALAGILLTSRVAAAETNAADGWSLDAVSAVIIGGTSLRGGEGGIFNTILGVFILAILNNGMVLMNVPSNYNQFVKGALIIVAVLIDTRKKQKDS